MRGETYRSEEIVEKLLYVRHQICYKLIQPRNNLYLSDIDSLTVSPASESFGETYTLIQLRDL
jgi:hypothetical protein